MLKDPSVAGRGWAITQVTRGGGDRRRPNAGRAATDSGGNFFGYSLRTPRWRYTEWDEGRRGRELYDHDADPRELTNLADDKTYGENVKELSQQLQTAVRTTFPRSGETPAIQSGLWAPALINP
jgi:iduronate 2-sulfatase